MNDRPGTVTTLDVPALLEQFGGLLEVLDEVVKEYLDRYLEMFEAVGQAVAASDDAALARSAHKLKGAVAIFGVDAATETVAALEHAGLTGDLSAAVETYERLRGHIESLDAQLRRLIQAAA